MLSRPSKLRKLIRHFYSHRPSLLFNDTCICLFIAVRPDFVYAAEMENIVFFKFSGLVFLGFSVQRR